MATSCYWAFPGPLTISPQTVSINKSFLPEDALVSNFITTRQPSVVQAYRTDTWGSGGRRRIKGVQTSYQEPILKRKSSFGYWCNGREHPHY